MHQRNVEQNLENIIEADKSPRKKSRSSSKQIPKHSFSSITGSKSTKYEGVPSITGSKFTLEEVEYFLLMMRRSLTSECDSVGLSCQKDTIGQRLN